MTRRRSFRHRPAYLPSGRERRRLVSMLMMLILLGVMINHTSKPQTWAWLVENRAEGAGEEGGSSATARDENLNPVEELIPHPTDEDAGEWELAQEQFRNIRDKVSMQFEEMPSYWRLFKWARAQSMADMESRAQKNPFFTQFWQQPEKMRGKLVTLRLQVRRILSHEAPENSAGVKRVYEIWGVTDESRGHPYVVITDQLPANLKEGADVRGSAVFCGYFLKILGYDAFDARRGAPLLIGKVRGLQGRAAPIKDPVANRSQFWQTVLIGGIVVVLLVGARLFLRSRPAASAPQAGKTDDETVDWLAKGISTSPSAPNGNSPEGTSQKQPPPFPFNFEDDPKPKEPPSQPE